MVEVFLTWVIFHNAVFSFQEMGFATDESTSLNGSSRNAHIDITVLDVLLIILYLKSLSDF